MEAKEFLAKIDTEAIVSAIRMVEQKTSGELRVFISSLPIETPVTEAQKHFLRMGMQNTREHNAVLIYIAPETRKFAVIGDEGVHRRCGEEFWRVLATEISCHLSRGDYSAGILHGTRKAGELLALHFPPKPGDVNELCDQVGLE